MIEQRGGEKGGFGYYHSRSNGIQGHDNGFKFTDMPDAVVKVEGNCDERGSAEYNLGLGDRRAGAAKEYLVQLGISADKIKTVSYGKERPQCSEASEACYQKNRRVHFATGE